MNKSKIIEISNRTKFKLRKNGKETLLLEKISSKRAEIVKGHFISTNL